MSTSDQPIESRFSELTTSDASRLLQLGLNIQESPIDQLLDRLNQPDGPQWLDQQLSEKPISIFGSPEQIFVDGNITLEQLQQIKLKCKQILSTQKDYQSRMLATIGYFFSIAASLQHHQKLLSSRKIDEIKAAMNDLSAITSKPWCNLFKSASENIQSTEITNPEL